MRTSTGSRSSRLLTALGATLLVVALAGVGFPLWWNHRSEVGGNLVLLRAVAAAAHSAKCTGSLNAAVQLESSTPGVLEVPSIGLVAPVLQGLTDPVLNVAVGHNPASAWPGEAGEAMVEAHDVSYFTNLSRIKVGQEVSWVTPCLRATYRVVATSVVEPGSIIYPPSGGSGLALVTCSPTDALYWTPYRFVVSTRLVSDVVAHQSLPASTAPSGPTLKIPAPAALAAQGLDLTTNSQLLGVLTLRGTPSASWVQGPGPLATERAALEVFFAARRTVAARNLSWWRAISTGGVAMPTSWPVFGTANVALTMAGTTPVSMVVSSGSTAVHLVVHDDTVFLSGISG
jgi:LPXTG-site transpeptidase (sortase) family protein